VNSATSVVKKEEAESCIMTKKPLQPVSVKLKRIIAGLLSGVLIGLVLECVGTFWALWEPTLHFLFDLPLGAVTGTGAFIGASIGVVIILTKPSRLIIEKPVFQHLPICAAEFIKLVIKKMRYREKVRADVQSELAAHFEDELKDCATDEEKEQKARQLITEFGDVKLLAVLMRRAKKRCRPLWRTVVARTFQTVGVLIVLFCFYAVWFLTGKPTISVDYLALFNQMNKPQVQDEDNAWPHYEKAIALFVEPDTELHGIIDKTRSYIGFRDLNEVEQQKNREWVKLNESAWQEFVAASSKSYCYKEYQYDPNANDEQKLLFGVLLPHLRPIRSLARLGIWRARIQMDANHPRQAIEDCLAIARAGILWQGKGTIIEQLVGIAVSNLAYEEILNIVETKELSPVDLKQFQQQLLQIYPQGYPLMNMEGERLCFMDTVQQIFTKGGPGGGHLVPSRFRDIGGYVSDGREHKMPFYIYTAISMVQAGRDKTINKGNEFYDRVGIRGKMSPYERHISDPNGIKNMIPALPTYRFFLLQTLMPAADRASELSYRGKALHQATVTVLALKQWRLEKNEYPANLDELVTAGYLKELPIDPYTDKPLIYKKTDDNFTLYSVGPNFQDDGGKYGKDDKGQVKKWADQGDTVFWPVQK
jgi:hypothetical protein